jgi:hypothetical protein
LKKHLPKEIISFYWERCCEMTINKSTGLIKKDLFTERIIIENVNKLKEIFYSKMKNFESKTFNTISMNVTKIIELKKKLIEKIKRIKSSHNEFDFKKELIMEVNKFNEINTNLSNKISKLEVEKTKLFFQIQNYESIIQKNEKKIKSLNDNLNENHNTIIKLNLKVDGLVTENSKVNIKDLLVCKEELEREKGMNFILTRKVLSSFYIR